MTINGYPIIHRPNHPRCNADGYIYEHTEVAEKKIGRFLKPGEIVHHRDKNRSNNNPDNLIVFHSKSDHTSFHKHNCDESLLIEYEPNIYSINYLKSNICPQCGKIKDKKAIICIECRTKIGPTNKIINETILTRDVLKQLIRTQPFTTIGKQYNVSDNAIRKWCDKYNLPRTKQEINSYTDEEWKLI